MIDWKLAAHLRNQALRAYDAATADNVATGTQVLVQRTDHGVVVAFRGSHEIKDWLTNARFGMEDLCWTNGHSVAAIHAGFLKAFESVIGEVTHQVRNLLAIHRGSAIFITGHSLGGALATLCALDFKRQHLAPAAVMTFGCPRVGNKSFAQIYNRGLKDLTLNFVAEGDPVPLVPTLLMGYRDCGHEVFLRRNGSVEYDPFIGWELFTDFAGQWRNWLKLRLGLLPNHSLTTYRERMENFA
jgi:triacylglycerol lipase